MKSRKFTNEEELAIIADYQNGMSKDDLIKKWEMSESLFQKIRERHDVPKRLTLLQRKVKECRLKGMVASEIVDALGIESKQIYSICKSIGYPFTDEEKIKSKGLGRKKASESERNSLDSLKQRCEKIGVEYLGGYTNSDGEVTIRLKCGHVVTRRWNTIRKISRGHQKGIECLFCSEQNKQKQKEKRIAEAELKRIERKNKKEIDFWKRPMIQRSFYFCEECGSLMYQDNKYCSEKCRKAVNNRRKKDRRLRKISGLPNIDLKKLYARDNGVCWLCGGMCDYEDYTRDEKGSFIVGKNYPSIDHVYPLSKGGKHTWDNVRLAHFYCNSLKSAKVVSV